MEPKEVVEQLFEAESRGDVDGIVRLMHEDVELNLSCRKVFGTDAKTTVRGREAAQEVYREDVPRRGSAFRIRATRMICESATVAAEWIAHCGPKGEDIRRGVDVFVVRDGEILQGAVYLDLTTVPNLNPREAGPVGPSSERAESTRTRRSEE